MVIDVDHHWTSTLAPDEYHEFIHTGNRALLREKVLDAND
jgi:hypothetical protein